MKGAASESSMGRLHNKVAAVFLSVLNTYEKRLEAAEQIDLSAVEDDMLTELFKDGIMPNPAMMAAITKFLKDNDISFETAQIEELSDTKRRLLERSKNRPSLATLTLVPTLDEVG